MDLNKLQIPKDAVKKELVMPDGSKTGVVLHLIGTDHDAFKKVDRAATVRQLKKLADKKGNINFNANNIDFDEQDEDKIKRLAACVVDWEGMKEDGKPLKCTPAKVLEFLSSDDVEWVCDFIEDFVGERANFIKG